jgi:HAD superfamily hydrolase (TIGR01509 family)
MTPLDLMLSRRARLRLIIFDCDGVLIDSEPIAGRVIAREVASLGWAMTESEAQHAFLGLSLSDMRPIIERRLSRPLPPDWLASLIAKLVDVMAQEAVLVPGALEALTAASDLGLAWRIASNSSHTEMQAKFACVGLTRLVEGRLHSAADVGRGKPFPDVYLAAAAAETADPSECLVIEDSPPGARAASAASMPCLGYAPHGGSALHGTGAIPFASMFDLPDLFRAAVCETA